MKTVFNHYHFTCHSHVSAMCPKHSLCQLGMLKHTDWLSLTVAESHSRKPNPQEHGADEENINKQQQQQSATWKRTDRCSVWWKRRWGLWRLKCARHTHPPNGLHSTPLRWSLSFFRRDRRPIQHSTAPGHPFITIRLVENFEWSFFQHWGVVMVVVLYFVLVARWCQCCLQQN